MALVKEILKQDIKTGLEKIKADDGVDIPGKMAEVISEAVDKYIKTATVTVSAGIPVSTAGTAAAQTGATTGPGTGTLN